MLLINEIIAARLTALDTILLKTNGAFAMFFAFMHKFKWTVTVGTIDNLAKIKAWFNSGSFVNLSRMTFFYRWVLNTPYFFHVLQVGNTTDVAQARNRFHMAAWS